MDTGNAKSSADGIRESSDGASDMEASGSQCHLEHGHEAEEANTAEGGSNAAQDDLEGMAGEEDELAGVESARDLGEANFKRTTRRSDAAASRKRKCDAEPESTEHEAKAAHGQDGAGPAEEELMDTASTSDSDGELGALLDDESVGNERADGGSSEEVSLGEPELQRMLEAPTASCSAHRNVARKLRDRERLLGGGRQRTARAHREDLRSSLALVRRFQLHGRLARHEGCVNALNFSDSGTLLASGSDDLRVVCWDWQRQRVAFEFASGHSMNVFQTRFVPGSDDLLLATCARDGQVRLAELSSTGKCLRTRRLVKHRAAAHKLSTFADDSYLILSCGEDAVVFELDLRHERPNRYALRFFRFILKSLDNVDSVVYTALHSTTNVPTEMKVLQFLAPVFSVTFNFSIFYSSPLLAVFLCQQNAASFVGD